MFDQQRVRLPMFCLEAPLRRALPNEAGHGCDASGLGVQAEFDAGPQSWNALQRQPARVNSGGQVAHVVETTLARHSRVVETREGRTPG